jgi:hypothetical protein
MNIDLVRQAVAEGYSVVCATCRKYHEAKARGLDQCLAEDGCGSPIVGDTFHEYDGPITDFLRFCFVCGDPAAKGVRVKGRQRIVGACLRHADYVVTMAPKLSSPGLRRLPVVPPEGARTVISAQGEKLVESLLPKPQKTLSSAMAQMEAGTFKPDC